ncbi:hypothetical protein [Mycoplasmopsis cynos]|uniref:hypothetical protein n=1 Tax=Mycoplasmopsis cynos TaxID=171284 RepID=UPI00220C7230|nr:hypothetical protein [Mycoplasmopsis cynos]UWV77715.1 hypothetical protein NW070_02235 [Mycoplasmopsis cynos]UWV81424.1 hypothetical protein NW065_05840 [Mycoplasmopsis cynos]WAM11342.1 hypothetical protein ONA00_02640 [Mycoplasmopsis cynos]
MLETFDHTIDKIANKIVEAKERIYKLSEKIKKQQMMKLQKYQKLQNLMIYLKSLMN